MGLNLESFYGAGFNISTLLAFNFQKHNPHYLKWMLAVVYGKTYYEQIQFLWVYIKNAREFQKNIYFCFLDYAKAFDCVDHKKLENSERDGNTRPPDLPLEKSVCRLGSNS